MKRKILAALFLILFVSAGSSAIVVNSEDWQDNALAISYSHFQGEDVHMVTNLGEGKLIADMLNENRTHTVFESSNAAWPDYTNYLGNQNIAAREVRISWEQDQYSLYQNVSENVSGFVVVKPEYGIDTISVFPKVVMSDRWLLYYQEGETIEFLKDQDKPVTFYGRYLDQPWEKLEGEQKVINTRTKIQNNRKMVNRLLEGTNVTSVTVAGDYYIEKGFLKKGVPIIVGQGVESTVDILQEHNISILQVVGAENVNFGNTIKDRFGEELTVIAKFGRRFTGVQGLQGTYPLKKLPVKPVERNIDLQKVSVDRSENGSDDLRLVFSNKGNIDTAVNFSAVQLGEGPDSVLVSEFRRKKIRPGHRVAMNFETNLTSNVSKAEISYDYRGKTGLTTQSYGVNMTSIDESSEVALQDLYYSKPDESLVMKVRNKGSSSVWVSGEIDNLEIFNRTETVLSGERVRVGAGGEKTVSYDVYLTKAQQEKNGNLTVTLASGGSETVSTRLASYESVGVEVKETSITGAFLRSGGPVIILLIILLVVAYRYGMAERLGSKVQAAAGRFN